MALLILIEFSSCVHSLMITKMQYVIERFNSIRAFEKIISSLHPCRVKRWHGLVEGCVITIIFTGNLICIHDGRLTPPTFNMCTRLIEMFYLRNPLRGNNV